MKTTVELPDATFRRVKAIVANRGTTLKQFFTTALEEQIRRYTQETQAREAEAPWMAGFGVLSDLSGENKRILELIEEEFEALDPEDVT
ncbi:MAG: hypothetical protein OXC38_05030 [Gammaproteobacteria bacterium]|nr:hypothetical protein [Gammaproteobacteria bacterium]